MLIWLLLMVSSTIAAVVSWWQDMARLYPITSNYAEYIKSESAMSDSFASNSLSSQAPKA
jgi:hypothetical protein